MKMPREIKNIRVKFNLSGLIHKELTVYAGCILRILTTPFYCAMGFYLAQRVPELKIQEK